MIYSGRGRARDKAKFALMCGATFAVALIYGCDRGDSAQRDSAPSALMVRTMVVSAQNGYEARQRFSGQVEPARESALGFELGGELAEILVDEGQQVQRDEVLARLDTSRLLAARGETRASLKQAVAQAELARATYARIAEARTFDGVSQQELDQAAEQRERAETAVLGAKARLDRIDVDIAKAEIRAPYPAVVVRRYIDEGQVVGAGTPVLDIQESAALRVRLAVTGAALDALSVGDPVTLAFGDEFASATVAAVIPRRNLRTRAVEMILDLDPGAPARVGDIAELSTTRFVSESGFWLPVDALTEGERGVWQVLAVSPLKQADADEARTTGATHRLKTRPVELLYEEAERVYVRGALRDGDRIVASGLLRVVPGQGVRVESPAGATDIQQASLP